MIFSVFEKNLGIFSLGQFIEMLYNYFAWFATRAKFYDNSQSWKKTYL